MTRRGGILVAYGLVARVLLACAPAPAAPVVAPRSSPSRDPTSAAAADHACGVADVTDAAALREVALRGAHDGVACQVVASRAGELLREATVEADVRALFASGRFDDVVAVLEEEGGARRLVYEVRERPRIAKVEVVGAPPGLDGVRLVGAPPPAFDPVWVRAAAAALVEELQAGGHRAAAVEHLVRPAGPGVVAVRFAVTAGPRFDVGAVRFEGLAKASETALRKELRTEVGEPAWDLAAERDALVVQAALFELGMVQGNVAMRMEEGTDPHRLDVVFRVEEGPVFTLGRVRVTGAAALPAVRYAKALRPLARRSIFVRSRVAAARVEVERLHQEDGDPRQVSVETRLDPAARSIDIDLVVE